MKKFGQVMPNPNFDDWIIYQVHITVRAASFQHIITLGFGQTLKHRKRMLYRHCYIPTTYKIIFRILRKKKKIR